MGQLPYQVHPQAVLPMAKVRRVGQAAAESPALAVATEAGRDANRPNDRYRGLPYPKYIRR